MKLTIIIIGIITVVGSVIGTAYAIIREIRKDRKSKQETDNSER